MWNGFCDERQMLAEWIQSEDIAGNFFCSENWTWKYDCFTIGYIGMKMQWTDPFSPHVYQCFTLGT